jgi:hypothetical protein
VLISLLEGYEGVLVTIVPEALDTVAGHGRRLANEACMMLRLGVALKVTCVVGQE